MNKEQTRLTTTEVLPQVAVVRAVETQVEGIKTEGALVEVAHQVVAAQRVVAAQLVVAAAHQAAVRQRMINSVSTTKTRMAIGATHRLQRDGVLDCFEWFDLFFILTLK